jgi:branched-chain amino acid transport system ATP-binding protein
VSTAGPPVLEVRALARRFDGLEALRGVTFAVQERELVALIGPNGAGKTTLLNVVAGALAATAGTVRLRGRAIDRWPPHAVNRAGIARTFQALELFPDLTVRENVMVAGVAHRHVGLLPSLVGWSAARRERDRLRALADEWLALVGLDRLGDVRAAVLPAGSRRLLGIARVLATGADVLLLDEPGAGLDAAEKADLAALVARLPGLGKTVLFVEHDMSLVGQLARRILVLDRGELIADGPPETIRAHPRVLHAYLGAPAADAGAPPPRRGDRASALTRAGRATAPPVLAVEGVEVAYGGLRALRGVSLEVHAGEIVALVGANGAGKSTLLRAVSGVAPVTAGTIRFDGRLLRGLSPEAIVRAGVSHVPEGRELFPSLTVWDNLVLGRYARFFGGGSLVAGVVRQRRGASELATLADRVFTLFPVLRERRRQLAGTLSGGEGQMLAIGRALMSSPRLLMLDEPSLGLAPLVAREILARLAELRREGLAILLVEQNAHVALAIADRGYVLETGRVVAAGFGAALAADPHIVRAYVGQEALPPAAAADRAPGSDTPATEAPP